MTTENVADLAGYQKDLTLGRYLTKFMNSPVSFLCARYWYRGVLKLVTDEFLVLTNPRAVEVTGSASSDTAEREDVIPSDLIIRLDFIEQCCLPNWVYHGLSKKEVEAENVALAKAEADRAAGRKPAPVTKPTAVARR